MEKVFATMFALVALLSIPLPANAAFELRPGHLGIRSGAWPNLQTGDQAGVVHYRPFGLASVRFDGIHGQAGASFRLARLQAAGYQEWMASVAVPVVLEPKSRLTIETEWMRTQPPTNWPGLTPRHIISGGLELEREVHSRVSTRGWVRDFGWGRARRPLGLSWKAGLGVSSTVTTALGVSAAVERSGLGRTRRELDLSGKVGRRLSIAYRWVDGAQTQTAEIAVSPLVVTVWRTRYEHVSASHGLSITWRRSPEAKAVRAKRLPVTPSREQPTVAIVPSVGFQKILPTRPQSWKNEPTPVGPLANRLTSFARRSSQAFAGRSPRTAVSLRSTWRKQERADRWRVDLRRGVTVLGAGRSPRRDPWFRLRTTWADVGLDAVWGLEASRSSEIAARSPSLGHRLGPSLLRPGRGAITLSVPVLSRSRIWIAADRWRTRTGVSVRGEHASFGVDYSSRYESRLWTSWGSEAGRFGFDLIGRHWRNMVVRGSWVSRAIGLGHPIRTRLMAQDRLGSPPRVARLSDPTALRQRLAGEIAWRWRTVHSRVTLDVRRSGTGPDPWDATRQTTRVQAEVELNRPRYHAETSFVWKETARRAVGRGADPGAAHLGSKSRGWITLQRHETVLSPGLEIGWQETSRKPGRWWGVWCVRRVHGVALHGAVAESWSESRQTVSVPLGGFGPRRSVPSPGALWTAGAEIQRGGWGYEFRALGGESAQERWGPEFRSALRLRWGEG